MYFSVKIDSKEINQHLIPDCYCTINSSAPGSDSNDKNRIEYRKFVFRIVSSVYANIGTSSKYLLHKLTDSPNRSTRAMKIAIVIITFPIIAIPLLACSLIKTILDFALFPGQQRFSLEQVLPHWHLEARNNIYKHFAPFRIEIQQNNNTLVGYSIPPVNTDEYRGMIVYFHGNAMEAGEAAYVFGKQWHALGYHSLFATYPGYGGSTGRILSEKDVFEAGQAFVNKAVSLHSSYNKPCPLILVGCSIGSGIAMHLGAENPEVDKVILHAPYFSLSDLIASKTGLCSFCIKPLAYSIDTHLDLTRFINTGNDKKVVMVHAARDCTIPYFHSIKLHYGARDATTSQITSYILKPKDRNFPEIIECPKCNKKELITFWHTFWPSSLNKHLFGNDDERNNTETLDRIDPQETIHIRFREDGTPIRT